MNLEQSETQLGKQICSREYVGNYELYNFKDGSAGLANDGRLCYFSDRRNALEYAVRRIAGAMWPACEYGYDVGICNVVVYVKETRDGFGAIGVHHAGDDRTLTVSRYFAFEDEALQYANEVNRRHHGIFEY